MELQLRLPEAELRRLAGRIQDDYQEAITDHQQRMERFRRYYRKWRNRADIPRDKEDTAFNVPLIQWNVFGAWADEVDKMLGDDAEIVAKPTGPSDQRRVAKIGRFMSWRVFDAMRLVSPFTVFAFRKLLFGRAHAYMPMLRETYAEKLPGGSVQEAVYYQGPGFIPLWPDDLILPAEEVETIQDFSWCIRRYRVTPDQLLRGEAAGLYQGISERFDQIVKASREQRQREVIGEEVKREKDDAEGVLYEAGLSARGSITVHEWYGWWRRLKGRQDADAYDLKRRDRFESELVVRYLPDLDLIAGVQDLLDLYPRMPHRRPFGEAALVRDGSYWSAGFGELLEQLEDETSVNHRLFKRAGQFSVGPLIFYTPGSGFDPDTFEYSPSVAIPTENPAAVNVIRMQADLQYPIVNQQTLVSYAERVTGRTDMTLGRQSDRPNAPRTARGTLALLQQGNIRANLDSRMFQEDMRHIVTRLWELEQQFPDPQGVFFRVTEEQAGGLFEVREGGARITAEEFAGRFDFQLQFATPAWSREARKEQQIALYQLDLANPLIAQSPRALWLITRRVHEALGDANFGDLIPEPPDPGVPRKPEEEWTAALQGEDLHVHPMDDDAGHLIEHYEAVRIERRRQAPDHGAVAIMVDHIVAHERTRREKMLMQAMTQALARNMTAPAPQGFDPGQLRAALEAMGGGAPAADQLPELEM